MKLIKFTILAISFSFFQNSLAQNWETINLSSPCTKRHENSLVSIGNKIILFGGRGIKPTEIFDINTQTWTKHADTPIEFHHFQAVTYNDEIYVIGAFTGTTLFPNEKPVENIFIYNIEKNEWRKGPELPKDRLRGAAGCTVFKNKIYLVGGALDGHWDGHVAWLDEYDPGTNTCRKLADAPHARDHVSVGVVNNKLYVAGDKRTSGKIDKYLNLTEAAVDVYDFSKETWQTLPENLNIPTQRAGSSAVVEGQKIIIIGGESASQVQAHAEVEALDIKKMKWEKFPDLVRGRHGTGAVIINGKIYTAVGPLSKIDKQVVIYSSSYSSGIGLSHIKDHSFFGNLW